MHGTSWIYDRRVGEDRVNYLRSNYDTIDILASESISQAWLYDGEFMDELEVFFNEKTTLLLVFTVVWVDWGFNSAVFVKKSTFMDCQKLRTIEVQDEDFIFSLVPWCSLSTDVYLIFLLGFIHLSATWQHETAVPTCNLLVTRYTYPPTEILGALLITWYRSFESINIAMVSAPFSFKHFPVHQVLQKSNMQFKVVSTLALATLVAAQGSTDANGPSGPTILPPFPGNPLPVVRGSDCSGGRLECCRFYHIAIYCSAMMKTNYYRQFRPGTHRTRCFRRPRSFGNLYRFCWWSCRSWLLPDDCRQRLVGFFIRFIYLIWLKFIYFASSATPLCCTNTGKRSAWACFSIRVL